MSADDHWLRHVETGGANADNGMRDDALANALLAVLPRHLPDRYGQVFDVHQWLGLDQRDNSYKTTHLAANIDEDPETEHLFTIGASGAWTTLLLVMDRQNSQWAAAYHDQVFNKYTPQPPVEVLGNGVLVKPFAVEHECDSGTGIYRSIMQYYTLRAGRGRPVLTLVKKAHQALSNNYVDAWVQAAIQYVGEPQGFHVIYRYGISVIPLLVISERERSKLAHDDLFTSLGEELEVDSGSIAARYSWNDEQQHYTLEPYDLEPHDQHQKLRALMTIPDLEPQAVLEVFAADLRAKAATESARARAIRWLLKAEIGKSPHHGPTPIHSKREGQPACP